jgi:hypothetical protein
VFTFSRIYTFRKKKLEQENFNELDFCAQVGTRQKKFVLLSKALSVSFCAIQIVLSKSANRILDPCLSVCLSVWCAWVERGDWEGEGVKMLQEIRFDQNSLEFGFGFQEILFLRCALIVLC